LKDVEPIEPGLDWDDPEKFDPERVYIQLQETDEPLFPK